MENQKVVRVGFVGFGKQAENHAKYLINHPLTSIEAICGTRLMHGNAKIQTMKSLGLDDVPIYFVDTDFDIFDTSSIEHMLKLHPSINALVISTPHTMHYPQAKFGLEHGLHILVDKPLAITYEDASDLVNIARNQSRILVVANQRRYEDAYSYVSKQLRSGELGEIKSINGILSHPSSWLHDWRTDLALNGGGAIFSIGHHLIDTIAWLAQDQITEVNAYASFSEQEEIEAYVDALIRFNNQSSATITINYGAPHDAVYERIQIWTSKGNITVDRFKPIYDREQPKVTHQYLNGLILSTDFSKGITKKWAPTQDFVDAIIYGKPTSSSGEQNLTTIQIIDAMYQSLRTSRRIELH